MRHAYGNAYRNTNSSCYGDAYSSGYCNTDS
jgi:hypothetical protein